MEDQAAKQRLVSYLLGGLQAEERREIEERFFDDDLFFEEMVILEEELIDSYVSGDLSGEEVTLFEKHYSTIPERRVDIRFARTLVASLPKVERTPSTEESHSYRLPGRSIKFTTLREQYRPLMWSFITILAIIIGCVVFLVIEGRRLYSQSNFLEQERASLSQQKQEADRRDEQLEVDLKLVEQERKRLESLSVASPTDTRTAIGMLFPMLTRSEQSAQIIHVSPQATLLLLQAPVESPGDKMYQAVLTQDGTEILRMNRVKSRSTPAGAIVEIPLTASMLNSRSYTLTIKPESGEEVMDIYLFEIQRP